MSHIGRRSVIGAALPVAFGDLFKRPTIGKPALPFTLTTFDGKRTTLAELAGKVVVLNFWAIWCPPCQVELPMFNVYVQKNPHPDLRLFAVAADDTLPPAKLKQLSNMVVFPLVKTISNAAYGPIHEQLPTNFIIDRRGIIRYAQAGAFDAASFAAVTDPLLAEPADPVSPA